MMLKFVTINDVAAFVIQFRDYQTQTYRLKYKRHKQKLGCEGSFKLLLGCHHVHEITIEEKS